MRRDLKIIFLCTVLLLFGVFSFGTGDGFLGELKSGIKNAASGALDIRAGAEYFHETREKVEKTMTAFLSLHPELHRMLTALESGIFSGETILGNKEDGFQEAGEDGYAVRILSHFRRQAVSLREYIAREMVETMEWASSWLQNMRTLQE